MNLGPAELLFILVFLALAAAFIGGLVFLIVRLANRGRR